MLRCKPGFYEYSQVYNLQQIIAALRSDDADELAKIVEYFKDAMSHRQRDGMIKEAISAADIGEQERIDVIKLLINAGANLKAIDVAIDQKQLSLLEQALVDNHITLSNYLWEQGLRLAFEHFPAGKVTRQNLEWLKQRGFNLCQIYNNDQTLLHCIVLTRSQDEQAAEDAIRYLIEQGVLDVKIKKKNSGVSIEDEQGKIKLQPKETEYLLCKDIFDLAAQRNHKPALRALIQHKFDKYTFRALESAVEHDNADVLKYLMEHYTIQPVSGEPLKIRGPEESIFFNKLLACAKEKCLRVLQTWQRTRLPEMAKADEAATKKQLEEASENIKKQNDEDALQRKRYKRRMDSNLGALIGGIAGCLIGFVLGSLFPFPLVSLTTCAVIGIFCGSIIGFGIAHLLSRFTNSLGVYTALGGEALGAGIGALIGYFFIPLPGLNVVIGATIGMVVGAVAGGVLGNCFNDNKEEEYRPSLNEERVVIVDNGLFTEFTFGKKGELIPVAEKPVSDNVRQPRNNQFLSAAKSEQSISSRQGPSPKP